MRLRTAGTALAVVVLTALCGCGGGSFVPPPPPELSAVSDPDASAKAASSLTLILRPGSTEESADWEQAVRREAGQAKVIVTVSRPGPKDPPAIQAALIHEAAG